MLKTVAPDSMVTTIEPVLAGVPGAAVFWLTLYVMVAAPVASVVWEIWVELLEKVIHVALAFAVNVLLGDPVTLILAVSPALGAVMSLVGDRRGAFSIAITREPNRTYSFDGKVWAASDEAKATRIPQ
jgi:hypothetical protein